MHNEESQQGDENLEHEKQENVGLDHFFSQMHFVWIPHSCSSKISKEQLIVPPKALVALAPTASGPARFHPRIFDQQGNFLLETLAKIKILLLHMNVFIMQWALFKMPAWKGRRGKCAWRTSLNKTNKMDDLKKTHPSPKKGVPNGECCLPHLVSNTCALVRTPPDTVRVSDYSS